MNGFIVDHFANILEIQDIKPSSRESKFFKPVQTVNCEIKADIGKLWQIIIGMVILFTYVRDLISFVKIESSYEA